MPLERQKPRTTAAKTEPGTKKLEPLTITSIIFPCQSSRPSTLLNPSNLPRLRRRRLLPFYSSPIQGLFRRIVCHCILVNPQDLPSPIATAPEFKRSSLASRTSSL
jgi:hypothetical protein